MTEYQISLRSGLLRLNIHSSSWPFEELCGFASRRSRKRGFVFVSKVLGKHFPVRPSTMKKTYELLANQLPLFQGPSVVIAMAETATALGQGVYDELWQKQPGKDMLFLHSTRYHLRYPLACQFEESHSHATTHRIYAPPDPSQRFIFNHAKNLILIDDEITTGNTLEALTLSYAKHNPSLQTVHWVCLKNWLSSERHHQIQATLPCSFHCESLCNGDFHFTPNDEFEPGAIPNVDGNGEYKDHFLKRNYGRLGIVEPVTISNMIKTQLPLLSSTDRILVLGTGEFAYPPYLLALWLEQQGHDVYYQSTTRSPLLVEHDLASVLQFNDNYYDDIPNFVYNVADRIYDRVLIGYETLPLHASHDLPDLLKATPIFF